MTHSIRYYVFSVAPLILLVLGRASYADEPAKAEAKSAAEATTAAEMKPYTQKIPGTDVSFDMVPIPGGEFVMGSPADEADRGEDEGPQVKVKIDPFWMGKHEVTWNEYELWMFSLEYEDRQRLKQAATAADKVADAVTRPTKPYTDMTFGMGREDYPAISMTQLAAKMYCKWLSAKTGHYYRLPTEAEWEYACRAGSQTAYSFGDDPAKLEEYGWFFDNAEDHYQKVGQKKPNRWGLYDMHGNVAEWCLDQYHADAYQRIADGKLNDNPLLVPAEEYPRVVRGGSWDDDPDRLRSAARRGSEPDWKVRDPQLPKSVWYHTDAQFLGFRVVRPLNPPTKEQREKLQLDPVVPDTARTTRLTAE